MRGVTTTPHLRRQYSLFAPEPHRTELDAVRALLDPIQHAIIPAHVTLCRDDEVTATRPDTFSVIIAAASRAPLRLTFGAAEAFDGHGLRLPCIDGAAEFSALRARLLGSAGLRSETPHITLAHPRNPKSDGHSLDRARAIPTPLTLTFSEVVAIELAPGAPWRVIASAPL